ncbi:MAG: rhomboid family intramembrane serine protease [Nanoarchaeota archaeon]
MAYIYRINPERKRTFWNFNVTLTLILMNVIVFITALILVSIYPNFIESIALKPSNIFQGKYLWTFLTSMFMHAGFFHLFVNMFSLLFVGNLVEKLIGRKRYFWFYIISGLFAGLFFAGIEFFFQSNPDVAAVGASGALFGIIGLLMVLTPNLPVYVMFIPIPIKIKYAAPGILIVLWLISISPTLFGGQQILIGNTAHLGGLILGIAYGIYLRNKYKNKARMISKYFS